MKRLALLVLACLMSAPCRASSSISQRLTVSSRQPVKADDKVRAWLDQQPQLLRNLEAAARQADAYRPIPDPDLRDSVSDMPMDRHALLASLPGMTAPDVAFCSSLKNCSTPPLAIDVQDSEHLRPAVRSLVRPWLLLAQARGGAVALEAAPGAGQRLLAFSLPKLSLRDVGVNVAARPEGGFHLWMDQALVLASVFAQERESALAAVKR